jgi:hypothetical protein
VLNVNYRLSWMAEDAGTSRVNYSENKYSIVFTELNGTKPTTVMDGSRSNLCVF